MPGELVSDPAELERLGKELHWYCETNQGRVKRPPALAGRWAVGPYYGAVRWLFATKADQATFVREVGLGEMRVVGYLGPLWTDSKMWD